MGLDAHREAWSMQGFMGGLCTSAPGHALDPDQTPDAENFDPSERFALMKRSGSSSFTGTHGSPTGTKVNGLGIFTYDDATARMLAKEGTVVNDVTAGNWTTAITGYTPGDSDKVYFTMYKNKIIITSSARPAPMTLANGSNAVASLGGSPPSAIYSCVHKGRLVLANTSSDPSRVYMSALNNEADWSTPNDATNFYVSVSDGMVINGLCSDGDVLYISKQANGSSEGALYAVFGDSPLDFRPPRRIAWFGAVNQWAFVPTQSFVVAACPTGLYGLQGTQLILLSEPVNKTWFDLTDAQRAVACVGRYKNQIYLTYPASGSTNTKSLVLDVLLGRWSRYTGHTVNQYATHPDGNLYGGSATTTIRVIKFNTGTDDIGSNISMYWYSHDIDFGDWAADKRIFQFFAHVDSSQARTWTVSYALNGTLGTDQPTLVGNTEGPIKRFKPTQDQTTPRFYRMYLAESSSSAATAYGVAVEATVMPRSR